MDETPNAASTPTPLWNTWDVIRISLGAVIALIAGVIGLSAIANVDLTNTTAGEEPGLLFNAALAALEGLGLFLSIYFLGLRWRKLTWSDLGIRPVARSWLAAAAGIAIVFIPLVGLIAVLIQLALDLPVENPQLDFLIPQDYTWYGALSMLVLGGVAVPVAEELFFRGVIYRWLRRYAGVWLAIPLSSAIFGILHGDIAIAGATAFMGLALAWFYERTKSLWPSIAIHIINNSFKLLLLYALIAAGINPAEL